MHRHERAIPVMSYLGRLIGAVFGFVLKLAILALVVNTIGGGWGSCCSAGWDW